MKYWARFKWPRVLPIDAGRLDLRPLETLGHPHRAGLDGSPAARGDPPAESEPGTARAWSWLAPKPRSASRPGFLQSVLDCMGDGVVVADSNARFLVFNPAAERILGQGRIDGPPQEWSRLYEVFLPDRVTPYPVDDLPLMRAIRGESIDQAELYIAYPSRDDGTWILVTGRPLRDEHGELQGGVVVFHDITRRKKSERQAGGAIRDDPRPGRGRLRQPRPTLKILETICESLDWDLRRVLESRPACPAAALRDDLASATVRHPSSRP